MKPAKLSLALPRKIELAQMEGTTDGPRPPSNCASEQLAKINAMPQVKRPLTAEQVYVRGSWAINDQPWHNGYRIETPGIQKIAELAIGAPVQANHDTYSGIDALPAGRIFDGSLARRVDGSTWALLWAWFVETDLTTELVQRMDGGAISEASIQILFEELECSICETDMYDCAHVPLQMYDGKPCEAIVRGVTDFLELSMVWAGMAKGTEWILAASRAREAVPAERMLAERSQPYWGKLFAGQPRPRVTLDESLFAVQQTGAVELDLFGSQ
jgi:hypothetical protein